MSQGSRAFERVRSSLHFQAQRLKTIKRWLSGIRPRHVTADWSDVEPLEQRLFLSGEPLANSFAHFSGEINKLGGSDSITITISPEDFNFRGRSTDMSLRVAAADGSGLDPRAVVVHDAKGKVVRTRHTSDDTINGNDSLVLAKLRAGIYTIEIDAEAGTNGAYVLDVGLAGDVNGDSVVDRADRKLVRKVRRSHIGDTHYLPQADVNRDGKITGHDQHLVFRNRGDSTSVQTLAVGLTPDLSRLQDLLPTADHPQLRLIGSTSPQAFVSIDVNGDGAGDQTLTASDSGSFNLSLPLDGLASDAHISAEDRFGQTTITTVDLSLDAGESTDQAIASGLAPLPFDFNLDDLVDATDIDTLATAIRNSSTNLRFDLDASGVVDLDDYDYLITDVMGMVRGDLNIDRDVTVTDLSTFALNFGATTGVGWAEGDHNGDGEVTVTDLSNLALNFNHDGPDLWLLAALGNDTAPGGLTNFDAVTSDPVVTGLIGGLEHLASLEASLGDPQMPSFVDITADVLPVGRFALDSTRLSEIAGDELTDGAHTLSLAANLTGGGTVNKLIHFTLDTTPPGPVALGLDPAFYLAPGIDDATDDTTVTVSGTADPSAQVLLRELDISTTADGTGAFTFTDLDMALGFNDLTAVVTDAAGNESTSALSIARIDSTGSYLVETTGLLVEDTTLIDLGHEEGSRTLTIELDSRFDTTDTAPAIEDLFQIYLVDTADPSTTLLDSGEPGTALFTLTDDSAEFTPGLVTYDGSTIDIDLTSLAELTQGSLAYRLINSDADTGTRITVASILNEADPDGTAKTVFESTTILATTGDPLDLTSLTASTDAQVQISNVRIDPVTGRYTAELQVHSDTEPIGRDVAVVFPGLPTDVTLLAPTGTEPGTGDPYISLRDAIPAGGLVTGTSSDPVQIEFDNPMLTKFAISPTVLVGPANQAPEFDLVGPQSVMPGGYLAIELSATDPDGDTVTFSVGADAPLPTSVLQANGTLIITPTPDQIGVFDLTLSATDGALTTPQDVTLTVSADPITTTRISGVVLDTDITPLPGITIELGPLSTTTAADGSFIIDLMASGPLPSDTLKIRGETFTGSEVYPFVAEKLDLMFGHAPYDNVNNVIGRPIYLPVIDVSGGTTIDPMTNTTVDQEVAPGEMASVLVEAGTLEAVGGGMFDGVLSITEVPPELTPAALPANANPDLVVTIQPAEMVFTTPAPLTLPNRVGYAPGTEMQLWSINPDTGQFDQVGTGVVSPDGSSITTTTGGITNSSWHFFLPPPPLALLRDILGELANQDEQCALCPDGGEQLAPGTSSVELHSGALREQHTLPGYLSLGQTRAPTLHYNSQRADPRPIVHFGFDDVQPGLDRLLVARVETERIMKELYAGASPAFGLPGGEHFWSLPPEGGDIAVALQSNNRGRASGRYDYHVDFGLMQPGATTINGTTVRSSGKLIIVNSIKSPFGAGWDLAGLQQLVANPDNSVLLIDGNGLNLVFEELAPFTGSYQSPTGDFSTLTRNPDGTYSRTMKDQTAYQFDTLGRLTSMTDRNGNATQWVYTGDKLTKIIDPAGLETLFDYTGPTGGGTRVTSITDPADRVTQLEYDLGGNLTRITDPDGTSRQFEYDTAHHLTTETDKRGFHEQAFYGHHGRVTHSIRKDGSQMVYSPLQTRNLLPLGATINPLAAPVTPHTFDPVAVHTNANGHVTETRLTQQGFAEVTSDEVGRIRTIERNDDNLVSRTLDGRGNPTIISYDLQGNPLAIRDAIRVEGGIAFSGSSFKTSLAPDFVTAKDVNNDAISDLITAGGRTINVLLGSADGSFSMPVGLNTGGSSSTTTKSAIAEDFDNDGKIDILTPNSQFGQILLFKGNGDGTFEDATGSSVGGTGSQILTTTDFDLNGTLDAITTAFSPGKQNISFLPGNSDGTFAAPILFPIMGNPIFITTGDLNDDGAPDIITGNTTNSISVLLGNGDGTAETAVNYAIDGSATSIAIADIDLDNRLDLVVTRESATDNGIVVFLGNGDGTFADPNNTPTSHSTRSAHVTDFTGDGIPDLATANLSNNDISIFTGVGDGAFVSETSLPAPGNPIWLTTLDANNDAFLDLAVAMRSSSNVVVFYGQEDGSFEATSNIPTGDNPQKIATADLNGDELTDVVITNRNDDNISILFQNGSGGLNAPINIPLGDGPNAVAIADVNGNDHLDIIVSHQFSDDVAILLGDGLGAFAAPTYATAGTDVGPSAITTGFLNADSHLDVVTTNINTNNASVLLGNGDGTLQAPVLYDVGIGPLGIDIAHIDGDAFADIVVANSSAGGNRVSLLLGNGDGTFQPQVNVNTGSTPPWDIIATDFNNDGLIDLAAPIGSLGQVSVVLGNGDGTFAAPTMYDVGNIPSAITSRDINGDHIPDLAVANRTSNDISILQGIGDGMFMPANTFISGPTIRDIDVADINDDGFLDLLATSGDNDGLAISFGLAGTIPVAPRLFTYDPTFSQVTSVTDENGHVTLFDIDPANGNTLSQTRVVGEPDATSGETDDLMTLFTYTPQGLIDTATDPLGRITDFDYDLLGRIEQVTFALGTPDQAVQQFEYDDAGNQTALIDENNHRTEFEYDELDRLTLVRDPLLNITRFEYDTAGNLTRTTDARGNATELRYDVLSRLTTSIDPDLQTTRFTYDQVGNLLTVRDPLGHLTRNTYDARNRLTQTHDPEGSLTRFTYDLDNNLATLTDPVDNTTNFLYDARNRLTRETDPLGNPIQFTYDGIDNLTRKTDRLGRVIEFQYDDLDRLTDEAWLEPDELVANTIGYTYDDQGNLLTIADDFSALTFTYDDLDRVKTVDNLGTPEVPNVLLTYTYDPAGNVLSVTDTIDASPATTTAYQYDPLNRNTQITQAGPSTADKRVDFTYNPLSQFASIERYSDLASSALVARTAYAYDDLNRLDSLTHTNAAAAVLSFFDFEYDTASRITAITDVLGRTDYSYDDRSQLTAANHADPTNPDETYTYDDNGNRTDSHLHGTGYATGPANRLLSDGTYTYEYDDEGNQIKRTEIATGNYREFEFDHRNRLIAVTDNTAGGIITQLVEYTYDALDRRITRTLDPDGDGPTLPGTTHFVYDREDVILDFEDPDAEGPSLPTLARRYLHGPGIDQILAQETFTDPTPGTLLWLLTDHLGTTRALADNTGAVLNRITYDSFGNVINQSNAIIATRYLFTGREYDVDSRYYYYRARYYESLIAKFIVEDPIRIEGGPNMNAYSGNDPIRNVDPYGEDYWIEGAVEGEGGAGYHQSICVGQRGGQRLCISFGVNQNQNGLCLLDDCQGNVYKDTSEQGEIVDGFYRVTSSDVDDTITRLFQLERGSGGSYNLAGNNCRTYSQKMFKFLDKVFGGSKQSPLK